MSAAVVVGSGPNGLAAAVRLAQAGVAVTVLESRSRAGGGARSADLTGFGLVHDECAGMHPTAVASPYLSTLPLADHGLAWAWPEVDLAHPLDDGRAGVVSTDMGRTTTSLGDRDGRRWERVFAPLAGRFPDLAADVFRPVVGVPGHPIMLARFGRDALPPATRTVRHWRGEPARALFMGVAAHAFGRLDTPLSGAVGVLLSAAGHAVGWPVAKGGSGAIPAALASLLATLGGRIVCGVEVTSLDQLREVTGAAPDVVMLDTTPTAALRIVGDRLPPRVRRAYARYRYGPAAHKVDFAIRGHVPWTNADARRAGTVHLGGSSEEVVAAEAWTARGAMPPRPFVLCGQQYLADPSRSVGDLNPFYTYAHVPHGYDGDATGAIIEQVERYAPGFRDTIVATHVRGPAALEEHDANYVGGDIGAGANDLPQMLLRPRASLRPYRTGAPGVYLCSSATPPGGGVHGMCGHNAAESALADLAAPRPR